MELKRILLKKNLYLLALSLILIVSFFYIQDINVFKYSQNVEQAEETDLNILREYDTDSYNMLYNQLLKAYSKATNKAEFFEENALLLDKFLIFERLKNLEMFQEQFPEDFENWNFEKGKSEIFKNNPEAFEEYESTSNMLDFEEVYIKRLCLEEMFLQKDYIYNYPKVINKIQANAESMLSFPTFSKEGSFSKNNIVKTASDFEKLENVAPELINDKAITSFLKFNLTDYFVIIFLIYIIFVFLEERKNGLFQIVHSTEKGRTALGIKRIGILLLLSVASVILVHGAILILSQIKYGMISNLLVPIQSVRIFSKSILKQNILEYLTLFFLQKALIIFALALCVWTIMSIINQTILGIIISLAFIGIQYILFTVIWSSSSINFLKYINFFALLDVTRSTSGYININFFTHPINLYFLSLIVLLCLITITVSILILIFLRKKLSSSFLKAPKLVTKIQKTISEKLSYSNMMTMELYKSIIIQKGFFVIIAVFALFAFLPKSDSIIYSESQALENAFYEAYQGALNEEKIKSIDEFLSGDTSKDSVKKAYIRIKESMNSLEDIYYKQNIRVWIVNPNGYRVLFSDLQAGFTRNNTLYVILFTVMLLSGINSYENQSNMNVTLKTSKNGRKKLQRKKILVALIYTTLVSGVMEIYNLVYVSRTFGIDSFFAPIQSILIFKSFSLKINILTFLILLFLLKAVILFMISLLIMRISAMSKNHKQAIVYSILIFLLPSALLISGMEILKPISTVFYFNAIEWIKYLI